jgi:hypothetical protein
MFGKRGVGATSKPPAPAGPAAALARSEKDKK